MLGFMRKHSRSRTIKTLFWMIILVFVAWGAGVVMSGGNRVNEAATVDGQVITAQAYQRAYERLHRVYQERLREAFTPEIAAQLNLPQRTLDEMVTGMLLRREASRLGLEVTDDEVVAAIDRVPEFQSDGQFDRARYLALLRGANFTPTEFEESQRETLLVGKLDSLLTDGLVVSERELHDRYVLEGEKIDVSFVKVPYAKYTAGITVTDAEVTEYYEKNGETYRLPERVTLAYVAYVPKDLEAAVPVSDEGIKAYYETHTMDFETPEKIRLRQILFAVPTDADDAARSAVRAKAEGVRAEAAGGADFAQLAGTHSADLLSKDAGGDLGWVERGKLESALEDAAFALPAGQVSEILESARGFHVLKVEEKQAVGTRPLEEVREQIVRTLREVGADQAARDALTADLARARGGSALEELASARGLKVTTSPPVARGQPLPGVTGPGLVMSALGTDAGAFGELAGLEPPYYLFKVIEKTASAIPPLDDVRTRVVDAVKLERAKGLAHTDAEAILAAAKGGDGQSGLLTAARAKGYPVEETGPFLRNEQIPKLGVAPIKDELFALSTASPFARVHDLPDASVVLALKERTPPEEEGFADKSEGLRDGALARRKNEVLEAYREMLKARADVSINPDVITGGRS